GDTAIWLTFEDTEARRLLARDRVHGHRYIGISLPVKLGHLLIIHAVEVIACEDQHIVRARGLDLEQLFADRVRRTLIPIRRLGSLFRRPNLHPDSVERVEAVRL